MANSYSVVDLFAGPGGLAEGFWRCRHGDGSKPFEIALSVEKEGSAHRTLQMRSFFRQFGGAAPVEYYRFLGEQLTEGELVNAFPVQWAAACREALQLELGKPDHDRILDDRIDQIVGSGNETVLIGGPPCQAYSLVGRSRNMGIAGYTAIDDHRHYLYRQYIRIIEKVQPAAFVMENVKGLLSSRIENEFIFERVLEDLRAAGGRPGSYTLVPLAANEGVEDYIVRAEDYGIPQCRHRVIVVGVRSDVAQACSVEADRLLVPRLKNSRLEDVLDGLPRLRSGLSRKADSSPAWRDAIVDAFETAAAACYGSGESWAYRVGRALIRLRSEAADRDDLPRSSRRTASVADPDLRKWYFDEALTALPNHETRSHMESDLVRYAFAATFAEVMKRSPRACEFPDVLAPHHRNWSSGKFVDRFRVQRRGAPSTTVTSHISKDGHYFIHPDPLQCRSLTVREAARLQTFPDNYVFLGNRTQQFVQVGNAVPPLLATQIAGALLQLLRPRNTRGDSQRTHLFMSAND